MQSFFSVTNAYNINSYMIRTTEKIECNLFDIHSMFYFWSGNAKIRTDVLRESNFMKKKKIESIRNIFVQPIGFAIFKLSNFKWQKKKLSSDF